MTAGNVEPVNLTTAAGLFENARQFDTGLQFDADQFNATNQFNVDEANQAARLRVAELNASLRGQQGQLTEQVRQFDIQDARERENMRFLLRKEQVATEEGNRAAFQSAVALQEQIGSRLENNRFQRQQLVTEVGGLNAQIENNVRVFNAQEKARVEQLNEQRWQANLQQLQNVSSQIGDLASNPADVGKLAAFLRSGNASPISSAIARGENAITNESLLGLRGLLGVREGLQQGPTQATANLIEANLVDMPQFGDLGQAPDVGSLYNPIAFDPSGIEGGPSPAAGDLGQFFQPIVGPGDIQATPIGAPGGAVGGGGAGGTGGTQAQLPGAPTIDDITSLPVGGRVTDANGKVFTNRGTDNGTLSALTDEEYASVPDFVKQGLNAPTSPKFSSNSTRDSLTRQGVNVDPNMTDDQIAEFFGRLDDSPQMERGGVARPGQPVIVGDSSDGKENQELAMVDARGNLVVVPLDRLPRAEEGGLFQQPQVTTQKEIDLQERLRSFTPEQLSAGVFGDGEQPAQPLFTVNKAAPPTGSPFQGAPVPRRRHDLSTAEGIEAARNDPNFVPQVSSGAGLAQLRGNFDPTASYTQAFASVPPELRDKYFEQQLSRIQAPQQQLAPAPLPAAPPARTVQQTAQNPAVGTGQVGLVSPEVARMFLTDVQRDALRRGGFTDPTQVSPLKVSAPGTSRFLQDLSASVAGTMGFGPPSLFFEELQRLRPTAVRAGVGRRTV